MVQYCYLLNHISSKEISLEHVESQIIDDFYQLHDFVKIGMTNLCKFRLFLINMVAVNLRYLIYNTLIIGTHLTLYHNNDYCSETLRTYIVLPHT